VLVALAGCQCFVPTVESDGGIDGGMCFCASNADCPASGTCDFGAPFARIYRCEQCVCRSFEAVCPPPDAGTPGDAGADAGADAGVDAGAAFDGGVRPCVTASQCPGQQPSTPWCADAGYSCIAGACVWECPSDGAGRTCSVSPGGDGGCLTCGATSQCPTICANATTYTATVEFESGGCSTWPGTSIPFTSLTFARSDPVRCCYSVYQTAGAQMLGELCRLDNVFDYIANFPGLGGWCTGRSAVTGAPRSIINCPACQFVVVGFE
jgi:hypothetical protein